MKNIFKNAKFGDRFRTRCGYMAIYLWKKGPVYDAVASYFMAYYSYKEDGRIVGGVRNNPYDIVGKWEEPASEQKQTESTCKWHTMDDEPLESGVILYSDRANRIYDGSYIGGGRFDVDRLSVPAGNFTLWCQRSEFFKECKLRESLDKLEE